MGNKQIPDEVTTAVKLAKDAEWKVSNRNGKIVITAPDGVNITIGHDPNDESLKLFRRNAREYNLVGQGPARTPQETERLHAEVTEESQKQADRLNAQRRAYEAAQQAKQRDIKIAREKAEAATSRGMKETTVSKKNPADLFPPFDPALLGTKDNTKFLLADGTYYCIECWEQGQRHIAKAPQGLATHRGFRHQMYTGTARTPSTQETNRVHLPADVDTALDMLRAVVSEAIGTGDPQALAVQEAEVAALRDKLESATKQADEERADFDKRFLEAQVSSDKRQADLRKELTAKSQAEVDALVKKFYEVLTEITGFVENYSPAQAVGKVDAIIRQFLK